MSRPSTTPAGKRSKIWIAPSVLMLGLFFSFYAFAFAQACTIGNVTGFVDCIVKGSGDNYTAYFGYTNTDPNITKSIHEGVGHYNEIRDAKNDKPIVDKNNKPIPGLEPIEDFIHPKGTSNDVHFAFSITFDATTYPSGIEWAEGITKANDYSSPQHEIPAAPVSGHACSPTITANVVTPLSPPIMPAIAHVGQPVTFSAKVAITPPAGATLPALDSASSGVVFTVDQKATLPGKYMQNNTWQVTTSTLAPGAMYNVVATYGSHDYANVSATVSTGVTDLNNFVACVNHNGNGTYTAHFGYQNNDVTSGQNTVIPINSDSTVGPVNYLTPVLPAITPPGQTTVFYYSGSKATSILDAFQVIFDGSDLVWNLAGHTATASKNSPGCVLYETVTTVESSLNPSFVGQSVTFTADVGYIAPSGSTPPPGAVNFTDENKTLLGTSNLDSTEHAALTLSSLTVGTHTITALYAPSSMSNYPAGNSGSVQQVVNKIPTATAVTSSVTPSSVGQNVTFTATVVPTIANSGTPSGTIQFFDGTTSLGTGTLTAGQATLSTATLALGTHNIQATYAGDATFTGSSGNTSQTVAPVAAVPSSTSSNAYFRIVESSSALASVSVAIDSATTFPNVASCTVQAYTPITAGSHTFAVTGSGAAITKSIGLTTGNYYTLVIVGGGSSTATAQDLIVIQDDLTIVSGQAKVRVYHFADGVGPVSVAANGTVVVPTLSFETASNYLTQTPGTVNYTLTLLNTPSVQLTDAINESANGVYSIFTLCGNKVTNAASAGLPSALPQTGANYTPSSSINWSKVIVLMNILLLAGAAIGGVAGFTVLRYRQTHR